jgi:hypothetical protein
VDNMVLGRNQGCLWIIDENHVTGMVLRMTDVYSLVTSVFPFSRSDQSVLKCFVEHVNGGTKNLKSCGERGEFSLVKRVNGESDCPGRGVQLCDRTA